MYKHNTHKIAQAHIHTPTQTGQIILIKQLTYYSQLDYTTTEQQKQQQTIKLMRKIIVLTRVLEIYELNSIRNPNRNRSLTNGIKSIIYNTLYNYQNRI